MRGARPGGTLDPAREKEDVVEHYEAEDRHARAGDRLVIRSHHLGEPIRDGEILEVRGEDGGPPFLVRWSDTGEESLLYPGSDAAVEHFGATKPRR
jgi:hypothetical protein